MPGDDFHPVQHTDPNGNVLPFKIEDYRRFSYKFDGTVIVFNAYAPKDAGATDEKWKIAKNIYDASGNSMEQVFADNSDYCEKILDDSPALSISAATKANPCELTFSAAHGLSTDDYIEVDSAITMTEINTDGYGSIVFKVVKVDATKVTLKRASTGAAIDSSAYGVYAGSGKAYQRDFFGYTYTPIRT